MAATMWAVSWETMDPEIKRVIFQEPNIKKEESIKLYEVFSKISHFDNARG
jgi:hypothetical protein